MCDGERRGLFILEKLEILCIALPRKSPQKSLCLSLHVLLFDICFTIFYNCTEFVPLFHLDHYYILYILTVVSIHPLTSKKFVSETCTFLMFATYCFETTKLQLVGNFFPRFGLLETQWKAHQRISFKSPSSCMNLISNFLLQFDYSCDFLIRQTHMKSNIRLESNPVRKGEEFVAAAWWNRFGNHYIWPHLEGVITACKRTSNLALPPATDIWWSTLLTYSNLFYLRTPPPQHLVVTTETHIVCKLAVSIFYKLLSCS